MGYDFLLHFTCLVPRRLSLALLARLLATEIEAPEEEAITLHFKITILEKRKEKGTYMTMVYSLHEG